MPLSSSHSQSAAAAIRSYARKCLASAAADIRKAGGAQGVHGARRGVKRLRSLLRLVAPAIGMNAANTADRHLRAAADLLAGARRGAALLFAATQLGIQPQTEQRLASAIMQHSLAHLDRATQVAAAAQALEHIAKVRVAVSGWHLPEAGIDFYLAGLRRSYGKARRGLARALASGDPQALHNARKHVIHCLHHLELLRTLWPEIETARLRRFNRLREALGDINDLAELRAIALPGVFPDDTCHQRTVKAIKKREADLLKSARKTARRLFARKPGAFTRRIGTMWEKALA